MKVTSILIATLAIFALTAQAAPRVEKETIVCKGIGGNEGVSLVLEAKSNSNLEGKAITYYATITDKSGSETSGIIFGYKEDVMLTLKPKRGDSVRVTGTIYMDESEQNLDLDLGHDDKIELKLDCSLDTRA